MPTHTGTHTHTHTHAHPHAHAHPRSHANLYVTDVTPSQTRRLHRGEKESSLFMKHVTWWKTGAAAWTRGMTNLQSPSLRRNEAHNYCDVSSSPDLMWSEQGKSRWLHTRGGQQSSFNFATTSACLFKLTCIGTCRHCRVLTVQLKRITPLQNKGALTMITLASTFLQFQRTPFSIALKWESQEVSFLTFFLAPVTSLRCYLRSGDLITTFISDKCWHT